MYTRYAQCSWPKMGLYLVILCQSLLCLSSTTAEEIKKFSGDNKAFQHDVRRPPQAQDRNQHDNRRPQQDQNRAQHDNHRPPQDQGRVHQEVNQVNIVKFRNDRPRDYPRPHNIGSTHLFLDDRFHHNHYYPIVGYSVCDRIPGGLSINFGRSLFYFSSGIWYQPFGNCYRVTRPPVGALIPILPDGFASITINNAPYYYGNDTYYVRTTDGYVVTSPPSITSTSVISTTTTTTTSAPPPENLSGQSSSDNGSDYWYYCASSDRYYPYVKECSGGWKKVPSKPAGE